MSDRQQDLQKQRIAQPRGVFFLYGEESYLVEQTARQIIRNTVGDDANAFDLHRFDGQTATPEQLEQAVEAFPMMSEYSCVAVRDLTVDDTVSDRLAALIRDLPDTCVLLIWQMTVNPDKRRKCWQTVLTAIRETGTVIEYGRKDPGDVARMLVSGAKRRGCELSVADARYLLELTGNDLNLLQGELDKLTALADSKTVTREMIDAAATKNLETRVFDLSRLILQKRGGEALAVLHRLFGQREEPLMILGALSTAFADLYRVKVAAAGGEKPDSLAADFKSYAGKEFRLDNAARDAARLEIGTLRQALEVLAATDAALKTGRSDERVRLEETVVRLIGLLGGGKA